MLKRHVFNLYGKKFTEGAAVFEHTLGGEGVDVNFYYCLGLEHNDRVTEGGEVRLERLDVKAVGISSALGVLHSYEKLGTVAVGHNAVRSEGVERNRGGFTLFLDGCAVTCRYIYLLAVKNSVEAVDDVKKSCSAAVNYLSLFKYGQSLRSSVERLVHLLDKVGKEGAHRAFGSNPLYCVLNRLACYCKYSALSGSHNRSVRLLYSNLKGVTESGWVCLSYTFESF